MKKSYFLSFLFICFLLTGCNQKSDKVRVGIILPLSGDIAAYGNDCRDGILYSLNELDPEGFELFIEDSKGEPKTAVTAYNKLVNMNKVNFILGDMFSNTTLAIAPQANRDKKLLISPTASSQEISMNGIYALSVFPSETFESELVGTFVNENFTTTGVLYEKVAAAQVMNDAFAQTVDIPVRFNEGFDSDTGDFRNILLKLKQANIESVYLIAYTNNAIKIIEQMKLLGIKTTVIGQSALYDPALLPYLANTEFKFYLTGPSFNSDHPDTLDTTSTEFIQKFTETYQKSPNQMSLQGYIAAKVAYDFYKQIISGEYTKEFITGYNKNMLGETFSFSENLTSNSGLSLYQYTNNNFLKIK